MNILKKLVTVPDPIPLQSHRYFFVGRIGQLFAITAHTVWMTVFFALNLPALGILNFFSVLIYLISMYVQQRGKLTLATSLGGLEVIVHQVVAVWFLGLSAGFQYYLLMVLIMPFLAYKYDKVLSFIVSSLALCTYALLEMLLQNHWPYYAVEPQILTIFKTTNIVFALLLIQTWSYIFNSFVNKAEDALETENQRAENLLHNILPEPIADRLKLNESKTIADGHSSVTVLFLDLVNFTPLASEKKPEEVVYLLNKLFFMFDDLTTHYKLEKIKTIGDAYMAAAGLLEQREDDAEQVVLFAQAVLEKIEEFNRQEDTNLSVRIGINTGAVVAGVIGKKKFVYDIWGNAVNIASRMESCGISGRIQISESTYVLVKERFEVEKRSAFDIKGVGTVSTYFVKGDLQNGETSNLHTFENTTTQAAPQNKLEPAYN